MSAKQEGGGSKLPDAPPPAALSIQSGPCLGNGPDSILKTTLSMAFRDIAAALGVPPPDNSPPPLKATLRVVFMETPMTDNHQTKRCTKCGSCKPVQEFYLRLRKRPAGPRRSQCKTCMVASDMRRYRRGPTIATQVVRHAVDPIRYPLSKEAEAVVYTDKPIDHELLRRYKLREKSREAEARRRERRRENELGPRPLNRVESYR